MGYSISPPAGDEWIGEAGPGPSYLEEKQAAKKTNSPTCGDFLVLANCSVGAADKNIWLYRIHEGRFEPLDALNLKVNENAEQVFNFCVDQSVYNNKQYFVAATQEGVIWVRLVEDNHLTVLGKQNVSTRFGAALALQQDTNILSVAGDNIHLFEVQ